MRNFYLEQSSGRYTVNGTVENYVTVPYNEARYGTNLCGDIVCSTVWAFVNDEADAFAAGKTPAQLNAYLAQFDKWDRYDADGDGNFNEPDGYIDHFQAVHAGEGEETGGGAQGEDAIWSHRWYAYFNANGPDGAGPHGFGGVRSAARTTGSATTPSSRRTAASASSRTSSATTSACPTSTTPAATPVAPRTRPASGPSTRAARTARAASPRTGSAPSRST